MTKEAQFELLFSKEYLCKTSQYLEYRNVDISYYEVTEFFIFVHAKLKVNQWESVKIIGTVFLVRGSIDLLKLFWGSILSELM